MNRWQVLAAIYSVAVLTGMIWYGPPGL